MPSAPSLDALQLEMRASPCPICAGEDFETLATGDRHGLGLVTVGCRRCGLLQTNPRPTAEGLQRFYAQHYRTFYQGVRKPSDEYVAANRKDVRLAYTVDFLQRALALGERHSILDYGCGEGSLFVALRRAGYAGQLVGVEADPEFGRYAAERGRATVHARLDDVGAVDAVVVNHVLEHIPDPVGLLRSLARHLNPGGAIYVDVPDAEEYGTIADLHVAHLYHFTGRSLACLAGMAGLVPHVCEKHAPPFHPRSVRLVATAGGPASAATPTPAGERAAWTQIRRLHRRSWRWTLRRRAAGLPALRQLYRWLRSGSSRR